MTMRGRERGREEIPLPVHNIEIIAVISLDNDLVVLIDLCRGRKKTVR